jgi:hypothetical protein
MARITLYLPDSNLPKEFESVDNPVVNDGVLSFRVRKGMDAWTVAADMKVTTTVPFLIIENA